VAFFVDPLFACVACSFELFVSMFVPAVRGFINLKPGLGLLFQNMKRMHMDLGY
jgi:hypothetical protein